MVCNRTLSLMSFYIVPAYGVLSALPPMSKLIVRGSVCGADCFEIAVTLARTEIEAGRNSVVNRPSDCSRFYIVAAQLRQHPLIFLIKSF
jgi:hypothetical protein